MTLVATAAALLLVAADAPNTLTSKEKKDGWILLFDGKSLSAFNDPKKKTPPGDGWEVVDGTIHARPHPNLREDLISNEKFKDFELVWEWKLDKGSNSGVKYRIQDKFFLDKAKTKKGIPFEQVVGYELEHKLSSREKPSPQGGEEYVIALEYQMIDDTHRDALRGPLYQTGGIYSMIPAEKPQIKPVGEWNVSRVVVKGEHVEHYLNGQKVVDAMLNSDVIKAAAAKRWHKDVPWLEKQLADQPKKECPVGLQHHDDSVWFRNIKIRRL